MVAIERIYLKFLCFSFPIIQKLKNTDFALKKILAENWGAPWNRDFMLAALDHCHVKKT